MGDEEARKLQELMGITGSQVEGLGKQLVVSWNWGRGQRRRSAGTEELGRFRATRPES